MYFDYSVVDGNGTNGMDGWDNLEHFHISYSADEGIRQAWQVVYSAVSSYIVTT